MTSSASSFVVIAFLLALGFGSGSGTAAAPEIAQVNPDYAGLHLSSSMPQTLTGENFTSPGLEVWVWEPPEDEHTGREAALGLGGSEKSLPAVPPKGARRITPLDVDKQVLVANLTTPARLSSLLWLKNADGFSAPYLFNTARPFWISQETAQQGEVLNMFGFGLRMPYRKTLILLKKGQETLFIEPSE